ncbi:endonuclease [Aequorivita sp. H23M31]|uniref:Endonuclease n=1 Tax=Aequorivita ciconiae TaxID=2494375 RepID=A0A410G281_9FLAO|nr:endonuclease/exonuclease/phosphatase family protein [Aequorivita sp. H23M31]QAA81345.1 endonuclease [Aequorivita sp. H23M31]
MGRFFNTIMYLANLLMAFLLLLSFILPYLPPSRFPTISMLSLLVPFLILINIIFALYWAFQLRRRFFISAFVIVASYFYFNAFYKISAEGNPADYKNTLTVMSYNVRLFNSYEKKPLENGSKTMKAYFEAENPDVVCFQEYYKPNKVDFSAYPYRYEHFKTPKSKLGNAIFSKYPLINKGAFDFKDTGNNTIYADVIKGKDTLRIYSAHLQSIGILPEVQFLQDTDNSWLRKKFTNAFAKQQNQINSIQNHKAKSKYPVIICGDFNNTPFSYTYRTMKGDMKDAFRERGNGLGTTFLFDRFPLRIDYILVSENLDVISFKTLKNTFSDHYAIRTTLGW